VLLAQDLTVTGKITSSEDGSALPGVNVVVKGTTTGTVSDANGSFSISAPSTGTLVFTFIGLTSQEVPINNRTTVDVLMAQDIQQLSEVVVTALNIPREKASLGYSTQQVKGDAVTTAKDQNFINSLSGKVAGVQIRRSNNFGGSTNMVIRGNKSVTGNNQPLFVVDGIPMDNSTANSAQQQQGRRGYDYGNAASDINPEDIETINVLKGAAASALYGSRASNGVVMITTKKGKQRQGIGISLSTGVTVGQMDKDTFVKYQNKYGGGYDGANYLGFAPPDGFYHADIDGDGVDDSIVQTDLDGSYGPAFDPNLNVYHWDSFVKESPNYNKAYPWVAAQHSPVDFFENEVTWNNSIALSGGNDGSTFRLSYTNFDYKGSLPNQDQKRHTLSFNGSSEINKKLTATLALNFVNTATVGRGSTGYSDNQMSNFRQWWQVNVDMKSLQDMFNKTGRNVTWNPGNYLDPYTPIYWDNPYWTRYKNYSSDDRTRVYGNFVLNYKATDWLNVMGRVTADTYNEIREERRAVGSVAGEFGINLADEGSGYMRTNRQVKEFNYDLIMTVNKKLSTDLNLNATLGGNMRRETFASIFASTQGGLVVPDLYSLSNSKSSVPTPIEQDTEKEVYGVFANANLGFRNMLYLDLSARNDKSSALPVDNNSYFYHSEALSFVFSEVLNSDFLDFGKVRVNYAEVGNDTGPQRTTTAYTKLDPFGAAILFSYPTTVNNPELKPERLISYEAGFELAAMERRLTFDLAFYKTLSKDQIVSVELSKATGASFKWLNGGEIENKGVEVTLGFDIIRNDNFKWNATGNWAKNVSNVNALAPGIDNYQINSFQDGSSLNATVGQPYGVLRGTGYQYLNGRRVVNSTGSYVAVANQVIGNPNPDWTGGLTNTFNYKGIQLSFLIDASHGGDVFSLDMHYGQATGLPDYTAGLNELGNPIRSPVSEGGGILFEGVQEDGSENTVRRQAEAYNGAYYWGNATRNPSQMTVYDASFIKLRELALTYNLPKKVLGNVFQGVALSLVGRNLWIIDKNVPMADPESGLGAGNGQGYILGSYPTMKTLGFKVDLNF
jgi:TonB-linked SusC/RagA family outer membrane protein